jgi:hypothetical protein
MSTPKLQGSLPTKCNSRSRKPEIVPTMFIAVDQGAFSVSTYAGNKLPRDCAENRAEEETAEPEIAEKMITEKGAGNTPARSALRRNIREVYVNIC